MMKKVSIIAVLVFALFVVNVSAGPLNSFEQNPISYWDDDSIDINVSWDSTDQDITIESFYSPPYLEDGTNASDWTEEYQDNADALSSDGTSIVFEAAYDGGSNDYYGGRNPTPSIENDVNTIVSVRYKMNVTNAYRVYFYLSNTDDFSDSITGTDTFFAQVTDWFVRNFTFADFTWSGGDDLIEAVRVRIRQKAGNSPMKMEVDYIHIWNPAGNLDIGIPITLQDQQTVELYINSTFLSGEVKLEIYDDTEALDTYCVFNSSYVVFPDDNYAQTDGLARIEFRLDNERNTGAITVFAENSSLINQYETSILSGTNFLRMIDSVFYGSIILYYLNGDTTYSAEFSIIEELFLSTGIVGYIGPLALVVVGWLLVKKDKGLGVIAFIVESLFVAQYLDLVEATPDYWWQIFILIFGMLFTVVLPIWDR